MPEEPLQFESHAALERDIARLTEEIIKRREAPGSRHAEGREIVMESLKSLTPPPAAAQAQQDEDDSAREGKLLPAYMKGEPAEIKLVVEELLELSLHKGIERGLKEARKASPFILDAFHDALVDKLYPELQKRGVVE
ncbi:MAG: hypothetical protein Q8Q41_04145 [bacterium]|nr:hypothetical protein [bacterium]